MAAGALDARLDRRLAGVPRALLLGLIVYGSTHQYASFPEWLVALDLLCGAAGLAALWVRRRWPVGLAVALAIVGAFTTAAGGAAVVALFTCAVHRPFRRR